MTSQFATWREPDCRPWVIRSRSQSPCLLSPILGATFPEPVLHSSWWWWARRQGHRSLLALSSASCVRLLHCSPASNTPTNISSHLPGSLDLNQTTINHLHLQFHLAIQPSIDRPTSFPSWPSTLCYRPSQSLKTSNFSFSSTTSSCTCMAIPDSPCG